MDERAEKRRFNKYRDLEKTRKLRLDDFVRAAMQHRAGRDYLYWLLELGHIGRNPFTANALTTSFNTGEMNVGQQILAHIIEVAPDGYLQMLKERHEEEQNAGRTEPDADPAAD